MYDVYNVSNQRKIEITSRARNRNRFPKIGSFEVPTNSLEGTSTNWNDAVCLAAPMISWKAGFNITGTIRGASYQDDATTTLYLALVDIEQNKTENFLAGCIATIGGARRYRVTHSRWTTPGEIMLKFDVSITFTVGNSVTISDTTTITNPANIRAPTNFDFALHTILYNETRRQYRTITLCDMESRALLLDNMVLTGWNATDNFNLRSEIPEFYSTVATKPSNTSITFTVTPPSNRDYRGMWLRVCQTDYSVGSRRDVYRLVLSVVGNLVTFTPIITTPLVGNTIEILKFSYDNEQPIQFKGKDIAAPYSASVEAISLPNIDYIGGSLSSLTHVGIEFGNQDAIHSTKHLTNTNNRFNDTSVWFCLPKDDSKNGTRNSYIYSQPFQKEHKILFDIQEPMTIRLINTTTGKELNTFIPDNTMPIPSWPELNFSISMVFNKI